MGQRLLDRQARYDRLERYYLGEHPLPTGDARYVRAFRWLQRRARTNYTGLIVDAVRERMRVVGFRIGTDSGGDGAGSVADADAQAMWQANEMDAQSSLVHLTAAVFGDAYVLVNPPKDGEAWPLFTPEDPRTAVTEPDPVRPTRAIAGLRKWVDEPAGYGFATVFTPESVWLFRSRPGVVRELGEGRDPAITRRLVVDPASWELVGEGSNPLGAVPLVRFAWRPTWQGDSRGEFEDVLPIMDRINATILDRMIISKAQAYKQRWARGVKIPRGTDGSPKPPWDPGADILWVTESPEADFGEFREADLRQVLEAARDDIEDIAAITRTPSHYMLGEVVNVSGDALKAAETGLVMKSKERMLHSGQAWEQMIRLGFRALGQTDRAAVVDAETLWADPESRSRAELADAVLKESTVGVPFTLLMERLGYTPAQIERARTERATEQMTALLAAVRRTSDLQPRPTSPGSTSGSDVPIMRGRS